EMPRFRVDLIFASLKPRVVITDADNAETLKEMDFAGEVLLYEDLVREEEDAARLSLVRRHQIDTDPIYIVFTSGSTGVPKGVIACHRSVIDYIEQLSSVLKFNRDTVFGNQTPLYFDACLKELYPTLKFGATTYLVPKQLFMFPVKLVEFLNEKKINTVCWVVSALTMISAFRTFDKVVPQYLHTVAFGSEVFPLKQFRRWRQALPEASFTNLYGPTEATGMSCYYEVDRDFEEGDSIPIGKPFGNTGVMLIDGDGREADEGEICIRGTCLTMGYYRNEEKTNAVFVQNPLNDRYPELIYRTGDMGRRDDNGDLIFMSRKDYQIKHMGHRIELGEIEAFVSSLDNIVLCCATYDREKDRISLFYTGDREERETEKEIKSSLPRYMLPHRVVKLTEMPMTPNGKIDRKTLGEIR
ncbi:MAG TPA: AMP-dependent synthetase, partial [Clostridiales bacterium]|nr:AMP-dependent synthetase [Clostridiales bacterium]